MIKLKDILQERLGGERTRKHIVLAVSRDIINAVKAGKSRHQDQFELYLADTGWESASQVKLDVKIKQLPSTAGIAYSISAAMNPKSRSDTLDILIELDGSEFPKAMSNLVASVKEVLEHELEHVGQQGFERLYVQSNKYTEPLSYPPESPQAPSHYLYLVSNVEIPAYVKGLLKLAKTKRISFEDALEDYYTDHLEVFDRHGTDWTKVKKAWLDWYNQNKDTPGRELKKPIQ
jgi:hypothetical protein